jgi:hypothetical protein
MTGRLLGCILILNATDDCCGHMQSKDLIAEEGDYREVVYAQKGDPAPDTRLEMEDKATFNLMVLRCGSASSQ